MDLDGDGIISMYEMEYFYEEMVQRMEAMGIETLPFEDCLCQVLTMHSTAMIILMVNQSFLFFFGHLRFFLRKNFVICIMLVR